MELAIQNLFVEKTSDPDGFPGEFYISLKSYTHFRKNCNRKGHIFTQTIRLILFTLIENQTKHLQKETPD